MELDDLLHRLVAADQEYRAAMADAIRYGAPLIRQARKQLGWTQREFAAQLGVDFTYISKIENGRVPASKPLLRNLLTLLTAVRADEEK
jgi:ribosome-binding protein aMBF1 (putative translation factor)